MKSVTEFANFTLSQALQIQTALAAEGKSPEEVQAGLGEKFKYEGDKLKHFVNALGIAGQKSENLRRVVVMSLAEGEKAPTNGTQIEEHFYLPEYLTEMKKVHAAPAKDQKGGGKGGNRGGKEKESPWGLSPEQKAAKKAGKPVV
jgi:hypothetical protein